MKKEELVLFPWIRKMVGGPINEQPHFGTEKNPVKMMMEANDNEAERFRKIAGSGQ